MSDHQLTLVFFIYGLSFFILGGAVFLQFSRRSTLTLARNVWLLGMFGLLHGANEWLDMFVLITPEHAPNLALIRALLLVSSFYFLALFGGRSVYSPLVGETPFFRTLPHGLLILFFVLVGFSSNRLLSAGIWARYLLALPGGLMVAYGMYFVAPDVRKTANRAEIWHMKLAAIGAGFYALFAGAVVPDAPLGSPLHFTYSEFIRLTGAPVQVFRTLSAIVITYGFVRALRIFDIERESALIRSEDLYRSFTQNFQGIAYRMTSQLTPVFFRGSVQDITGYTEDDLTKGGPSWPDIIHPIDAIGRKVPDSGKNTTNIFRIIRRDGTYRWVREDIRTLSGEELVYQGSVYDITREKEIEQRLHEQNARLEDLVRERTSELMALNLKLQHEILEHKATADSLKHSLTEKTLLLRELHHRVKNNLQTVSSLLKLRGGQLDCLLRDTQNRIRCMALVHEKLYSSDDLSALGAAGYFATLIRSIQGSFEGAAAISVKADISDLPLDVDTAIPLGLAVNELLSLYIKRADACSVHISLKLEDDSYVLRIGDDSGCFSGIAELEALDSVSFSLLGSLLEGQLGASVRYPSADSSEFRVRFKPLSPSAAF